MGTTDPVPASRIGRPEVGGARGTAGGHHQACGPTHVSTFVCDPSARGLVRHPDGAGAARPRGRQYDDGVHARAQSLPARRAEPRRPPLKGTSRSVGRETWRPTTPACVSRTCKIVDLSRVDRWALCSQVRGSPRAQAANPMVTANHVHDRSESSRVNMCGHQDMRSECYESDCRVWTRGRVTGLLHK
jgi:hypothetical protein